MSTPKDIRDGARAALIADELATSQQIFMSKMPASPDKVLVLTWYPVPLPNTEGLQVRVRGSKNSNVSAEDWADDIRVALHGLEDLTWGATHIAQLRWASGARIGFDSLERDEVALNFYATTSAPSTSLVD